MIRGPFEIRGDFGHAVGAGRMIGAGHRDLAAEAGDRIGNPAVVRGDDDPSQRSCLLCGLDHVLDQWPPGGG